MTTAHDTIAAQVDALHAGMATQMPADVGAAFAAEQAGLRAGGAPAGVEPAEVLHASGTLLA